MKNNPLSIVLSIVVLILLLIMMKTCSNRKDKIQEYKTLIDAIEDEAEVWKDKDSLNHAKIQAIETQYVKTFLDVKSKDSTIIKLQALVKANKGKGVTIVESTTRFTETIKVVRVDTVNNYSTYRGTFNKQGWVSGEVIASIDSIAIDLKVKNEYDVIIGQESQGWFKPKITYAEVINHNPYTKTNKLKTYQVKQLKPKRFGIGPFIGVGLGTRGFVPVVGIGVQYNLIRF